MTLVLDPAFPFAALTQLLADAGWRALPDPLAPEPAMPGEPELAWWSSGDARLVYGFHPAIGLRTLDLEQGPAGTLERLAGRLPLLDVDRAVALLGSGQVEEVLLGIAAVREAGAVGLLPTVLVLTGHDDERVAEWATGAAVTLAGRGLGWARAALEQAQREAPDRLVLFESLPRSERLQVLRWWMALGLGQRPRVVQGLRSALADDDWEVRATALVACGRLRRRELDRHAAAVALPEGTHDGLLPGEREVLVAVRDLVVQELRGVLPARLREGLLGRAVLRGEVAGEDLVARLLASLTTPLPDPLPAPERLPEGVVQDRGSLRLRETDVELIWVPAVPHWLGDSLPPPFPHNPVRRWTPEHGFLIGDVPIGGPLISAFGIRGRPDGGLRYADAVALCRALAERSGADVQLPSSEQWEMAARGPDARRYPWGNQPVPAVGEDRSPWGGRAFVGYLPQWTRTPSQRGRRLVAASPAIVPCALRYEIEETCDDVAARVCVEC